MLKEIRSWPAMPCGPQRLTSCFYKIIFFTRAQSYSFGYTLPLCPRVVIQSSYVSEQALLAMLLPLQDQTRRCHGLWHFSPLLWPLLWCSWAWLCRNVCRLHGVYYRGEFTWALNAASCHLKRVQDNITCLTEEISHIKSFKMLAMCMEISSSKFRKLDLRYTLEFLTSGPL